MSDGAFQQTVWQPARLCIPLFRPGCRQRVCVGVVLTRAVVVLLSERAWHRADYEGGLGPEKPGVSTMG